MQCPLPAGSGSFVLKEKMPAIAPPVGDNGSGALLTERHQSMRIRDPHNACMDIWHISLLAGQCARLAETVLQTMTNFLVSRY